MTTEARTINAQDEPLIWLRGERAGLGPHTADLVDQYWQWEQDPAVMVGYGQQAPIPLSLRREGYQQQARISDELRFTVYDMTASPPAPAGTTAVRIAAALRTGEFVIQLGTEASRGRGIGTEATRLTLDYAFHISNLECVYLTVLAPNTRAIAAYERAGFRKTGERRNSGYWLGKRVNEILMDAIPEDFPGPSAVRHLIEEEN